MEKQRILVGYDIFRSSLKYSQQLKAENMIFRSHDENIDATPPFQNLLNESHFQASSLLWISAYITGVFQKVDKMIVFSLSLTRVDKLCGQNKFTLKINQMKACLFE